MNTSQKKVMETKAVAAATERVEALSQVKVATPLRLESPPIISGVTSELALATAPVIP